MKLSGALNINQNAIRVRTFQLGGQDFKVRIPLASEMEAINKAVEAVDWKPKFEELAGPLKKEKKELQGDIIEFKGDDVFVEGKSVKELAMLSAKNEERITQMVRLLVPADEAFDMASISYADINAEWPFSVQMDLMKKIVEVISPGYEETRKN